MNLFFWYFFMWLDLSFFFFFLLYHATYETARGFPLRLFFFFLRAVLVHSKIEMYRNYLYVPTFTHAKPPPLLLIYPNNLNLLKLMYLHWHIIFKVCRWPYVVRSGGFWKCIHHYTVTQIIFSAPRSSVFYLSFPLPTPVPSNHWYSYCLYSFVFSRMSYVWNHIVCSFQIGFFLSVIFTLVSSISFHGLKTHFFLVLSNIPLSKWITAYPFTY